MKKFSAFWLIAAVFVAPCVLDLENLGCIAFVMVDAMAAFAVFYRYNPEYIIREKTNNKTSK